MRRYLLTGFVSAGLILCALSSPTPARGDDWSRTFRLTGRSSVHIITNEADVQLSSTEESQVVAHVITDKWKIGEGGVQVIQSQSGNDVSLEVRVPRTFFHFFGGLHGSVRVEMQIPQDADLDVQTGDGDVTSAPFHGQLRISTGDGSIDVHGLKGQVRLHTGDGHINGDGFDGTLRADSGDGHLRVSGRFDTLSVHTGDGSVIAEAASGSRVSSAWSLRSGDGSITLRLAEGLNAELDAHTGDGRISLDFPVTISGDISHSTIQGKLGSGGLPLVIHTGDGSIHIARI